MADQKQQTPQPRDRRRDVETLAADLFARKACLPGGATKTPEAIAADALTLARAFYRVCDEPDKAADKAA